jgi:hypothetical protein
VNGFPLAKPLRIQACAGKLRKNARVDCRAARNFSIWLAQANASACEAAAATSCSKFGNGLSNPREPECPKEKDALAVSHVVGDLANAPLTGRVALERFFLAQARKEDQRIVALSFENPPPAVTSILFFLLADDFLRRKNFV